MTEASPDTCTDEGRPPAWRSDRDWSHVELRSSQCGVRLSDRDPRRRHLGGPNSRRVRGSVASTSWSRPGPSRTIPTSQTSGSRAIRPGRTARGTHCGSSVNSPNGRGILPSRSGLCGTAWRVWLPKVWKPSRTDAPAGGCREAVSSVGGRPVSRHRPPLGLFDGSHVPRLTRTQLLSGHVPTRALHAHDVFFAQGRSKISASSGWERHNRVTEFRGDRCAH